MKHNSITYSRGRTLSTIKSNAVLASPTLPRLHRHLFLYITQTVHQLATFFSTTYLLSYLPVVCFGSTPRRMNVIIRYDS